MNLTSRKPILLVSAAVLGCAASAWATLADYQNAVTNESSVISYFTFDRTNANDALGAHNGTTQSAAFSEGIGSAGRSLLLSGAGRVSLGPVPDFDFADGTGSVEAWVRPGWSGNFTAYNPCLFADRNGGPVTWSVHMNGDKSGVGVWNGSRYLPLPIPPPSTNWHHLVVTFDNSSSIALVSVYWDGNPAGSRDQDLGAGSNPTQLGSSAASVTDEGWLGGLDEVAFYADALSPSQVLSHYQALFAGTPPVIVRQPRGGNYLPGVNLQLSVAATGPNLSYQWFRNGNALAGATGSVLTLTNLATGNIGTYHVVVSNPGANVPSIDAVVTLGTALPSRMTAYQAAVTNESSLSSYYQFDRLTAADSLGLRDGALQGTAYFGQGVAGGPDQGLLLDGLGHINLGTVPDFDFADGSGSIEAWVQADWSSINYAPCLFADRDGGPVTWSVHMNADKKAIGLWNGTTYQTIAFPDAGTNWHHVGVIFDTGSLTLYWDGVLLGTIAEPLGTTPASIQLGSSAAGATAEGWVGMLDEVAFYPDALSGASVQTHYRALVGSAAPSITVQPVGGAFYPGPGLQLAVWAFGADLTYQWFKNGIAISGATNWSLNFAALAPSDSGTYDVRVANTGGSVNSASAQVQVANDLARYQAAVLGEASLISYYTFDGAQATDAKGTNDGVLIGSAAYSAGVGQGTDQSLLLDGGGNVNLGTVNEFDFTNGTGTVEAWVRPDWTTDPGYDPCIFADRDGGPTDWSIHLLRNRDGIGNWNGSHFQSLGLSNTGGWHHYAVAFGAGLVSMYWDGQALGTFAQPIGLSTELTTQIGSSAADPTAEGWIGAIDEVAFYRATLSSDTIYNHFLAMVGSGQLPTISFSRSGDQLSLSWPLAATGFILESTDGFLAPSWTPVPGVVSNQVTVAISSGNRFYRLRQ